MPGHYGMKKPAMKKGAKKMPAAMMAKMKKKKATKKQRGGRIPRPGELRRVASKSI